MFVAQVRSRSAPPAPRRRPPGARRSSPSASRPAASACLQPRARPPAFTTPRPPGPEGVDERQPGERASTPRRGRGAAPRSSRSSAGSPIRRAASAAASMSVEARAPSARTRGSRPEPLAEQHPHQRRARAARGVDAPRAARARAGRGGRGSTERTGPRLAIANAGHDRVVAEGVLDRTGRCRGPPRPRGAAARRATGTSRSIRKPGSRSRPWTCGSAFRYDTAPSRTAPRLEVRVALAPGRGDRRRAHHSFTTLKTVSRSTGRRPASRTSRTSSCTVIDLRRRRARVVGDLLLGHGAVDVVGAEREADLREPRRDHDPVRLDVREVVEHQPRHGDRLQVVEAGRLGQLHRRRFPGLEGERDEGHEAARLVLQLAQPQQVVDAVLDRLDVAVEHRRVRRDARAGAPCASRRATARASALPLMILLRVSFAKISAPPPGIESSPASFSSREHLLDAHPVEAVEEEDLDRGEGLDVDVGPDRLDPPQHVGEVGRTAGRGAGRPRCAPRAPRFEQRRHVRERSSSSAIV